MYGQEKNLPYKIQQELKGWVGSRLKANGSFTHLRSLFQCKEMELYKLHGNAVHVSHYLF